MRFLCPLSPTSCLFSFALIQGRVLLGQLFLAASTLTPQAWETTVLSKQVVVGPALLAVLSGWNAFLLASKHLLNFQSWEEAAFPQRKE